MEEKKEYAVKIDNIYKTFRLPTESTTSLKRTLVNYFKGIKGYQEQHVLRGLSFGVEKGDFFGIVGRNGSGKSTLLKIISQIYVPEQGTVEIDGKLVSFIELGVGFNPELTGKENVYLNGAMLGFSDKEVDEMYDDIVNFAELHEFMNQKLKNYSSGMQVRLAFSVAIQAKSDILVLDEVLAVGDEAFQRKCNDYFTEAKEVKKTIILVTHDMNAVRKYCNRAVLIDRGEIKVIGTPDDVANQYSLDNVNQSGSATVIEGSNQAEADLKEAEVVEEVQHIKDFKVKLLSPQLLEGDNREISFEISYNVLEDMQTYIAFSIEDIDRNSWMYNDNSFDQMTSGKGLKTFRYTCQLDEINQCKLKLNVSIRNDKDEPFAFSDSENSPVIIISPKTEMTKSERISSSGVLKRNGQWVIETGAE
ncbi:ABC transporter ATP-binding protein [Enterococcus sp. HY326]|uniref:ABC transporter ATP-binding protein n=1 Tax=Enterococcus sp. HY326 TaxID=2971265 RepID=UPI00223F72D6|nr:ABC transporter ATP-binding protein [Enterococcus sp. HY326]